MYQFCFATLRLVLFLLWFYKRIVTILNGKADNYNVFDIYLYWLVSLKIVIENNCLLLFLECNISSLNVLLNQYSKCFLEKVVEIKLIHWSIKNLYFLSK